VTDQTAAELLLFIPQDYAQLIIERDLFVWMGSASRLQSRRGNSLWRSSLHIRTHIPRKPDTPLTLNLTWWKIHREAKQPAFNTLALSIYR
jgi:hypothetical protein